MTRKQMIINRFISRFASFSGLKMISKVVFLVKVKNNESKNSVLVLLLR